MSVTLAEFILARIAEDEQLVPTMDCPCGDDEAQRPDCADRVAREVDAKRQIVELHEPGPLLDHFEFGCTCGFRDHRLAKCLGCGARLADEGEFERPSGPCPTLILLAMPYSDHPEWRGGWVAAGDDFADETPATPDAPLRREASE